MSFNTHALERTAYYTTNRRNLGTFEGSCELIAVPFDMAIYFPDSISLLLNDSS